MDRLFQGDGYRLRLSEDGFMAEFAWDVTVETSFEGPVYYTPVDVARLSCTGQRVEETALFLGFEPFPLREIPPLE